MVLEREDTPRAYVPEGHKWGDPLPVGLKVKVVHDTTLRWDDRDSDYFEYRAYGQIVTLPGQEREITEADDVWTRMDFLRATGGDGNTTLGDESTPEGAQEAEAIRNGLPEGRSPGESPFNWSTSHIFALSIDGATLSGELFGALTRMLTWAIDADMLADNAIMTDGVRSPETAHRNAVAANIQFHPERAPLENVRALDGGTDEDGNVWYEQGDTDTDILARARAIRADNVPTAEGYDDGARAAPDVPGLYLSPHTTGLAIDCYIPWRKAGDATSGGKDPAGWETIYNRFGLHRPVSGEDWHIELIGKPTGATAEDSPR